MKNLLWMLFLILISANLSLAQNISTASAPAKPTVIKYDWSKEIVLPSGWDWTPFGASSGSPSESSGGSDSESSTGFIPPVERLPYYYLYILKIKNTDARAIAAVAWEYTFIDPGSNEKLDAHQFYSYELIPANSNFTLRSKSRVPPSKIVSLQGLEKNKRSPYIEQVEIKCVMFTDGTFWRYPSATSRDCAVLKIGEKLIERSENQRRQ